MQIIERETNPEKFNETFTKWLKSVSDKDAEMIWLENYHVGYDGRGSIEIGFVLKNKSRNVEN